MLTRGLPHFRQVNAVSQLGTQNDVVNHPRNNINNICTGYRVLHLDVYQGAHAMKVNVDKRAAALSLGIQNDVVNCYRPIAMDSGFQCPELTFILRE